VNQRNQSGGTALAWALRGNEQEMARRCGVPAPKE
jgi:hypothetical protein